MPRFNPQWRGDPASAQVAGKVVGAEPQSLGCVHHSLPRVRSHIIPTLILFLILQRYIYNGFTSGATK